MTDRNSTQISIALTDDTTETLSPNRIHPLSTWGAASPTSILDTTCFALLVRSPELPAWNDCKDANGAYVRHFQLAFGFQPKGSILTAKIPNGISRYLDLVAIKSTNGICPSIFNMDAATKSQLSEPKIVASTTVDLEGTPKNVEMFTNYASLEKFSHCSGPSFNWGTQVTNSVSSIHPSTVLPEGRFIEIYGNGFLSDPVTTVMVGASVCSGLNILSESRLQCLVTPGTMGESKDILVYFSSGTQITLSNALTYVNPNFGDGADGEMNLSSSDVNFSNATTSAHGYTKTLMASRRIEEISTTSPHIIKLGEFSVPNDFNAGDEIMWYVTGEGQSGDCGVGRTPGKFGFSRIIATNDNLNTISLTTAFGATTATNNANYTSSNTNVGENFCRIQVIRVPNFNNLTLANASTSITTTSYSHSTGVGGLIAFRVKANLSLALGARIDLSGKGYSGGQGIAGNAMQGVSYLGNGMSSSVANGSGGGGATSSLGASGGANCGGISPGSGNCEPSDHTRGDGGMGTSNPQASHVGISCSITGNCALMGGGGGGSLSASINGSSGGGFFWSKVKEASGTLRIQANAGVTPTFCSGCSAAGGGAGGSIYFAVDFGSNLTIDSGTSAVGSQGGGTDNNLYGGGGGGGLIRIEGCATRSSTISAITDASGTGGGSGSTAGLVGKASQEIYATNTSHCSP